MTRRLLRRPHFTPSKPRRSPMGGRFWISGVVMSVLFLMSGFVVHGVLLHNDYAQLPNLLRPEAEAQGHFMWMLLADALMGFGFTWIYLKGREAGDRKSTRLNSSHLVISYAVFCLKKKKKSTNTT